MLMNFKGSYNYDEVQSLEPHPPLQRRESLNQKQKERVMTLMKSEEFQDHRPKSKIRNKKLA